MSIPTLGLFLAIVYCGVYFTGYTIVLRRLIAWHRRKCCDDPNHEPIIVAAVLWPAWVWTLPWVLLFHYAVKTAGTTRQGRKIAAIQARRDARDRAIRALELESRRDAIRAQDDPIHDGKDQYETCICGSCHRSRLYRALRKT